MQVDHSQAAHEPTTTGSCNECGVVQLLTSCAHVCSCMLSCMGRRLNSPCRSTVQTQPAALRCSTLRRDGCAMPAPDCWADVQRQLVPCFSAFEYTVVPQLVAKSDLRCQECDTGEKIACMPSQTMSSSANDHLTSKHLGSVSFLVGYLLFFATGRG